MKQIGNNIESKQWTFRVNYPTNGLAPHRSLPDNLYFGKLRYFINNN
jgi:hypothetical protein